MSKSDLMRAVGASRESVLKWTNVSRDTVGVKPDFFRKILDVLQIDSDIIEASSTIVAHRDAIEMRTFEVIVPPGVFDEITEISMNEKIPMEEAAQEWVDRKDAAFIGRVKAMKAMLVTKNPGGLETGADLTPGRQAASKYKKQK